MRRVTDDDAQAAADTLGRWAAQDDAVRENGLDAEAVRDYVSGAAFAQAEDPDWSAIMEASR